MLLILDLSGNELERVENKPAPSSGAGLLVEDNFPRPELQVVKNDVDIRRECFDDSDNDFESDEGPSSYR